MILIVNTIISDRLLLGLVDKTGKLTERRGEIVGYRQAEKLLLLIDALLKKKKLKITDLRGVIVVSGPGGFSSVRLGIMLANTLGYSLNIPVVGLPATKFKNLEGLAGAGFKLLKKKKKFSFVQPFYGAKPNITKSKNKILNSKA